MRQFLFVLFLVIPLQNFYSQDSTGNCPKNNSTGFSIFIGMSKPTGGFGSVTQGDSGGAKIGYSVDVDYTFKVPLKGSIFNRQRMSFLLSIGMSINQYNVAGLGFSSTHENGAGYWTTIWGLMGPKYHLDVGSNSNIYFLGQLGLLIAQTPEINSILNFSQSTESATSLLYSLGFGLSNDMFNISFRYFNSKPEFSNLPRTKSSNSDKKLSQQISMLQFLVGINW